MTSDSKHLLIIDNNLMAHDYSITPSFTQYDFLNDACALRHDD
jgi:hypothetical protein